MMISGVTLHDWGAVRDLILSTRRMDIYVRILPIRLYDTTRSGGSTIKSGARLAVIVDPNESES